MELTAVDIIGIRPEQFWELSLRDYDVMLRAAVRRHERERCFAAAMTANLMNCLAKKRDRKPFTADDLLGTAKKKTAGRGTHFADADPKAKVKMFSRLMEKREKRKGKNGKQATSTA